VLCLELSGVAKGGGTADCGVDEGQDKRVLRVLVELIGSQAGRNSVRDPACCAAATGNRAIRRDSGPTSVDV
jgi:hypothetical protein